MKKRFLWAVLLALVAAWPASPAKAGVSVDIGISLPPFMVFPAPPHLVVIPETNVYAVPDVDVDIFFYGGWWWRPWEGRWYRSRSYDSGWIYYRNVPDFYRRVPQGWRHDYREHRWQGHRWDYRPVPHGEVERNWRSWEKNRHWERQNHWGVQGLKPQAPPRRPAPQVRPPSQPRPPAGEFRPRPESRREASQPPGARQGKPERGQRGERGDGQGRR
jgi:hypothetical protein